jgi:hypothetical protein
MQYKHYFVQCSGCGAVVGVLPKQETNVLIHDMQKDIDKLKEAAGIK